MTPLLVVAGLFAAAALYTSFRLRQIRDRFRPDGAFADIDGVRLHYHHFRANDGQSGSPTLVFLHGASGNAYDLMMAFKGRFPAGRELVFVDRPGLGHSERRRARDCSPTAQAHLIAGLLDELQISSAVAVGHSLGASVAAALGLVAADKVHGLIFLAPATHPWPGGVNWYYSLAALPVIGPLFCWTLTLPIAERLAPKAINNVFLPDAAPPGYAHAIQLPLLFRPQTFRANACDIAMLKGHLISQSKAYPELDQPALIVTGTQDTVVWPSIHSDGLLRELPNASLLVLDGAGHMPQHTHRDAVVRAIEDLLKRVGPARIA